MYLSLSCVGKITFLRGSELDYSFYNTICFYNTMNLIALQLPNLYEWLKESLWMMQGSTTNVRRVLLQQQLVITLFIDNQKMMERLYSSYSQI